ncbi:GNAT family N-acetyltransferase [Rhodobacteraceae bacterium NNCM2]|nr:GNAT family N-acetyltransferase [Coraliihabitans acroporae]
MPYRSVRRLGLFDQPAIEAHFRRLDEETLRQRFGGNVAKGFVDTYLETVLHHDHLVFGAFIEGEIRAVAELIPIKGLPALEYEGAFSVEPEWQNKGFGEALISRAITAAQNRGARTVHMLCLSENRRMQHLAAKHDGVLKWHGGEVEAIVTPPLPTPLSLFEEMAGEAGGLIGSMVRPAPWYG